MRQTILVLVLLPTSLSFASIDIGIMQILQPPSSVDTGTIVTPTAWWRNVGTESTGFTATCALIREPDSLAYLDSVRVTLLVPGRDTILEFPGYQVGYEESDWRARFWNWAPGDTNRANDALEKRFRVSARRSP
jgi:hypothetical protein